MVDVPFQAVSAALEVFPTHRAAESVTRKNSNRYDAVELRFGFRLRLWHDDHSPCPCQGRWPGLSPRSPGAARPAASKTPPRPPPGVTSKTATTFVVFCVPDCRTPACSLQGRACKDR